MSSTPIPTPDLTTEAEQAFDILLGKHRTAIESYLAGLVPAEPASLYDPVRHVIEAGGKRIRPILTSLTFAIGSADKSAWLPVAAAVELLHTFTLVHDDIMDNADSRRGRPTTHVQFGSNAAILSGDVIIALALESLAKGGYSLIARMLEEFALGFRLVCDGQALDKDFELRSDIGPADYLHMIDLKTSKIIEMSAVLGVLASGDATHVETARAFALHSGLAFQILDDLLDLTADEASFGKTIGGDILEGKRTYLFVDAMSHYDEATPGEQALLTRIGARVAVKEDVELAREAFARLGVLNRASSAAREQTELAQRALNALPDSLATSRLRLFSNRLLGRST